ncbi:MAG: hypothetical protein CM15mP103_01160 [Gammaproteobacteria bacterium]|nr:MAG: hypothetical protein CM15mP103_01160 [Gammaproteobacteria bacterium]
MATRAGPQGAVRACIVTQHGAIGLPVGGMGFELSKFNRATQAKRQPGSNFKPFLYASALEAGITPSTVINDAPVVLDNLSAAEIWRPENDSGKFYGPTRLREALTFSRNLVSIRVLQRVGVRRFIRYVEGLGLIPRHTGQSDLALGTHTYTPLEIATGYAILANEGFKVEPWLIERIENAKGEIVYAADPLVACAECAYAEGSEPEEMRMEDILGTAVPEVRAADRVMDPGSPSSFPLFSTMPFSAVQAAARGARPAGHLWQDGHHQWPAGRVVLGFQSRPDYNRLGGL